MKHLLLPLLLVASAMPVLARDQGGDGPYIPDYQTLVREGFGPGREVWIETPYGRGYRMYPMPTQAFYANGYTVYYGFQPEFKRTAVPYSLYALGYPAEFYSKLMPDLETSNLDRLVVTVATPRSRMGGSARSAGGEAVTRVQNTSAMEPAAEH